MGACQLRACPAQLFAGVRWRGRIAACTPCKGRSRPPRSGRAVSSALAAAQCDHRIRTGHDMRWPRSSPSAAAKTASDRVRQPARILNVSSCTLEVDECGATTTRRDFEGAQDESEDVDDFIESVGSLPDGLGTGDTARGVELGRSRPDHWRAAERQWRSGAHGGGQSSSRPVRGSARWRREIVNYAIVDRRSGRLSLPG